MRIAFAVPVPEEYGFGRYLRLLLHGLAAVDSDNEYLLFAVGDAARGIRVRPPRTREIPLPPKRPTLWWRQRVLVPACREQEVDVMHFHNSTIWLRKPVRTVVTVHHVTFAYAPEEEAVSWIERTYVRHLYRRIARDADRVITDSPAAAADLRTLVGVEAAVVPLAPDPACRPVSAERVAAVRGKYGLARPYVFFAGSLGIRKNLPRMIRAFSRFRRTHDFAIAGGAPKAVGYRGESFEGLPLESVRFLGFVPEEDLPALYAGAAALFYATSYEGFGMPILEAFTCGCPVVTSNRAAAPETAGGAAVLVDPDDEASMADGLARAFDERASLVERGIRRAAEFSWERTARETLAVYRGV